MVDYGNDFYERLGAVIALLAGSSYHSRFELRGYLRDEIAPAFRRGTIRFFHRDGDVIGFVTWSTVSETTILELAKGDRPIREAEWQSGQHVLINDLVVTEPHGRDVISELKSGMFADHIVHAFRRHANGSIKRRCRFIGDRRRSMN